MENILLREYLAPKLLKVYKPTVTNYLQNNRDLWQNKNKLFDFQSHRLSGLIFHAYKNTIYYKRIFDEINLIRNGRINWDRFDDIPLLTKQIIRENFNDILSIDSKKRHPYLNTSGGSTGEPLNLAQDRDYYNRMVADTLFFAELYGKKIGEKEIKLWGSERDIFKETMNLKQNLINWFFNRILLNSFKLNSALIKKYLEVINVVKPKMIWAYVDSICEVARFISRHNIKNIYQPLAIVCTAGTFYKDMQAQIQKAFPKSNILNQYGSREVGIIGIGQENIEIFQQSVMMELFDKSSNEFVKDKGVGNIILTVLNNYSMPLIKYDIGDLGEANQIRGNKVESLKKLNGRENSHIIKRNGEIIHGELFTHLFYFITINIQSTNQEIKSEVRSKIRNKINQIMGATCEINFHIQTYLPKLQSGKYQFVFSKVKKI